MPKFEQIPSALISLVFSFSSFATGGHLAAASSRMKYVSELPSSSPKVLDFDFSVPPLVSNEASETKEQRQLQNQSSSTAEMHKVSKRLHHPEVLKCIVGSANNVENLDKMNKMVACLSEQTIRSLLHADSSLREIEISVLDTKDKNKGVKKIYLLPLLSRLGYQLERSPAASIVSTTPIVFIPAANLLEEYEEKKKKVRTQWYDDSEDDENIDDYDEGLSNMQIEFTHNASDAAEAAANPSETTTVAVNKKLEKLIFYRPGLSYEWLKEPIETLSFLPRLEALTTLKTDAADLCPRLVELLPPNLTDLTLSVSCSVYGCQETNCSARMKKQDWKQLGQLPLRRLALYTENDLQEIYKQVYLDHFDRRSFKTTRTMMVNMALHLHNLQELHCPQVPLGALQVDPSEKSGPIKFENLRHFSYVACDINDKVPGGLIERFSAINNLVHCSSVSVRQS